MDGEWRSIAGGAWIGVKVNGELVALANNCGYNEDFNVQPANVLNYLGPISYDSQGYSCNLKIGLLVARDQQEIIKLIPTREQVKSDGKMPVNKVEFIDTADQKILESFSGVVLNSHGMDISPNSYVTADLQYFATQRNNKD